MFGLNVSWVSIGGYVYLRRNDVNFGELSTNTNQRTLSSIINLDAGDEITLFLQSHSNYGGSSGLLPEFFGVLISKLSM